MAANAANATFVSADVVSVAISAPSKNRASRASPARSIRFSRCGGFAAVFFAGFFAMRPFYGDVVGVAAGVGVGVGAGLGLGVIPLGTMDGTGESKSLGEGDAVGEGVGAGLHSVPGK